MKRVLPVLLIMSLVLFLSACLGNQPNGDQVTGESTTGTLSTTKQEETTTLFNPPVLTGIADTKWALTAWSVSAVNSGDYSITLEFDKKSFSGHSAVNSYSGDYITLPGGKIKISNIYQTEMAGSPEAMQAESIYLGLLGSVEKYAISNGALTLLDKNSNEMLIFEKAP